MTYVLAHGVSCEYAVLLSDDCAIEKALGLRPQSRPVGRLLFAPLAKGSPAEFILTNLQLEDPVVDRTPTYVDLGRVFSVHAPDLAKSLAAGASAATGSGSRMWSMTDGERVRLQQRWAAYSCRLGPRIVRSNLEKWVDRLPDHDPASDAVAALRGAINELADRWWTFETEAVEGAGADTAVPFHARNIRLKSALRGLVDAANRAQRAAGELP